jgi:hypothetical protein
MSVELWPIMGPLLIPPPHVVGRLGNGVSGLIWYETVLS